MLVKDPDQTGSLKAAPVAATLVVLGIGTMKRVGVPSIGGGDLHLRETSIPFEKSQIRFR